MIGGKPGAPAWKVAVSRLGGKCLHRCQRLGTKVGVDGVERCWGKNNGISAGDIWNKSV